MDQMLTDESVGKDCDSCGKVLKTQQIAIQCDHCDNWHMLLGDGGMPETRQTSEGFRMFSFPAVDYCSASGEGKPNVFIFIEEMKSNVTNGESHDDDDDDDDDVSTVIGVVKQEQPEELSYQFVQEPNSGELILEDSIGFRYAQRGGRAGSWRCLEVDGNSHADCPATVTQRGRGGRFIAGQLQHTHPVADTSVMAIVASSNEFPAIAGHTLKNEPPSYQFVHEPGSDELFLVDGIGFRYTQRGVRAGSSIWRCVAVDGESGASCPATVAQRGDNFTPSRMQHTHCADDPEQAETTKSGLVCEVSQGLVSCQIEDAQITPVRMARAKELDHPQPTTFQLVVGGTQLGNDMLIDNLGYSYRRKQSQSLQQGKVLRPGAMNMDKCFWQCCVYNKRVQCTASVMQKGDTFVVGRRRHTHLPGRSAERALAISQGTDRRSRQTRARLKRELERKDWPLRQDEGELTYECLEGSTQRHRSLLIDSLGFTYTERRDKDSIRWRCSVRNIHSSCNACIVQIDDKFTPGRYAHVHPPNGANFKAINALKSRAVSQFFRSITSIVDEVIAEHPSAELKRPNMIRIASRYRQHVLQAAGVSAREVTRQIKDSMRAGASEVWMDLSTGDISLSTTISSQGTLPSSSMPPDVS